MNKQKKKKPLVSPTTIAHTQEVEEHTQEVEEHLNACWSNYCRNPTLHQSHPAVLHPRAGRSHISRAQGSSPDATSCPGQGHGQESNLFNMFFHIWGISGGSPCEHGDNMQTSHRKAREIVHLNTDRPGKNMPPVPTRPHAGTEPRAFFL